MPRPKVALYWCAACGGCEEAIVDFADGILNLIEAVEIVFWPVAMDFKKSDVIALPDKALLATLLNGAIRTSEQEEMARLLRQKSRYLIAYGACACSGGIPGLANQFTREQLLRTVYVESPTLADGQKQFPQGLWKDKDVTLELPAMHHMVRALDQVVEIDYYIPGCPPTPKITEQALNTLLAGKVPARGSVLAPDVALCEECPRRDTKPLDVSFKEFKRPHQILLDPDKCLLAQGVVCCGPGTRSGCGAPCIAGNMPCTGCCGPTSRVRDQGAKLLSALSAHVAARDEAEIDHALGGIPDPLGTFYRYALPRSLLRRHVNPAASADPVIR